MPTKPYSVACDQNRDPILSVIAPILQQQKKVLEIGSGTGQHALYFAQKMPHLAWHTSDRAVNHAGIRLWLAETSRNNIHSPLNLDVNSKKWQIPDDFDAIFSANTTHIMNHHEVALMFNGVGKHLTQNGIFLLYGPFNYNGKYTSDSNKRFDHWLKRQNPDSSIKNFEWLETLAQQAGLTLKKDYTMPANNRILHWVRE